VAGPPGEVPGPEGDVLGPAGTRVTPAELPEAAGSGPAAVVCLLFEHAGEANVVLTRRSAHLRSHSGEVSFPGGRLQFGEAPLQAALREANEEIGVDPAAVEIIGHLAPLTTVRSPALVHCFVAHFHGSAPESLAFAFNPGEVEKVFWVSLAQLASDGVYHEELWPVFERPGRPASQAISYRAIPFFRLDEDIVWGATGRLLTELLGAVLVRRAGVAGQGLRAERRSGRSGGYPGGT
jgi:8-oxo-dGTP pyrophosphatase MutT (NUDIX family)